MNELKILLTDYLKTHNLTRNTFIQKLGYTNTTKGLRRLDEFIEHPKNNAFKVQLCKQLDISIESMDEIINKQMDLILKDKIKNFIPRIWIKWNKEYPLLLGAVYLSSPFLLEAIFYSGKAENLSNSHL